MKRLWWGMVLLAVAAGAAAGGDAAGVRMVTLDNGLKVLLAPDSRATAVDVGVWYRAGTLYEKPGKFGITYLLGHLMFRGSREVPSGEHRKRLEAEGASVNSVTNPDFTCFYETLPPEALDLALRLEADRMGSLSITQEALDQERRAAREERRLRVETSPPGRGLQELYGEAFAGYPYAYPVMGADKDLGGIALADVRAYYRERYAPGNALITLVGRFDPATALQAVRRHFGALPRRVTARPASLPLPEQKVERRGSVTTDNPSVLLLAGWRGPGDTDPDSPALEVLSHILTGGSSSRLARGLLGPKADFLRVQGELDRMRDASLLICMALIRPGADSAIAERELIQEVERLTQQPVPDEELERAKKQIEASILFDSQTVRDRAQTLGTAEMLDGDYRAAASRLDRLRGLTPADLQRAAAKVLRAERRTLVWVQPPRSPAPAAPEPNGEGRP